ncbi:isoleucyl-tRNA synthetase [Melanomma pulvis-pyrius CBS 109.77]|uniref:Isoleucine--tRNA ligase, mitochondrial n=1 Tax=Melanomma pulvis-pyrius CBS 109.77 TaxID=1314802 RepID=A0A6A6XBJ6_9PLEO|nr:isoleucyl-tRNA synthetase [Melanomma pulvis-pyrius CBS 109.77]
MLAPTRFLRASWSSTLRLPKSNFPVRPLPASNAEYLRRCTDELYAWQQTSRANPDKDGKTPETFTLHDGPPYANGPLHIGHALNKITKDIICRSQVGQGKKVSYIPGWDCHGLPIEIKALQAQKKDANSDPVSVRAAARDLATSTVEEQKSGFKEWAVMGDWDNAYKTMERDFEIRQLEVFKQMFEKGLIYRQFKPVYWSPSSRTALAEAELEYDENHKSVAAFVRFPVHVSDGLKNGALSAASGQLNVVIWTTTPWTLPANKAIAVHKDMEYCVVQDSKNEMTIVAASRVEEYQKTLECELTVVISSLLGSDLAGNLKYENPFQKANGLQPVIHADFVTSASGTGLVHLAPGHGMDDYHVCSALGIPAFAPVDDAGAFTKDAFPEHPEVLEGMLVSDAKKSGTAAVVKYLKEQNLLRGKQSYRHKYPIDWRTKEPVIVRATEQWFANIDGIKEGAMKAIEGVKFVPDGGRPRLESFIQGRSQWCISRQRAWGVPIPALYRVDEDKHEATMNSAIIQNVIDVVKERGIDAWWTDPQDEPAWKPKNLSGSYVRGRDTMDVWFDSGTSWTLLPPNKDQPVADVYLEGTDQHRGWFQSSLLTYVATQTSNLSRVKAPYKTLITHGFTLDSEGRKMSKSVGNVISPYQIMSGELLPPIKRKKQKGVKQEQPINGVQTYDSMGSDALRLWVASSDYTRDVTIGQPVLLSVNQALHKYRVTFKWLLGIFSLPSCPPAFISFNSVRDELPNDLSRIKLLTDKLALHRLAQVSEEVHDYYAKYEFFKGVNTMNKYISNDLSAFYFETLKDRVYTGTKVDCQNLQNVLGIIFYELTQMLAPICPLLVEEVWDFLPETLKQNSVHPAREPWAPFRFLEEKPMTTELLMAEEQPTHLDNYLLYVDKLGSAIKVAQERLRAAKKIGSSLECDVLVTLPDDLLGGLDQFVRGGGREGSASEMKRGEELAGLFVVSRFEFNGVEEAQKCAELFGEDGASAEYDIPDGEKGVVFVSKAGDNKCPRCWRFVVTKIHGEEGKQDKLCQRCEDVVREEGL